VAGEVNELDLVPLTGVGGAKVEHVPVRHSDDLVLLEGNEIRRVEVRRGGPALAVEQKTCHVVGCLLVAQALCVELVDVDGVEGGIAADMVNVLVRVGTDYLSPGCQVLAGGAKVSQAKGCVDEKGLRGSDDKIAPHVSAPSHDGWAEDGVGVRAKPVTLHEGIDLGIVLLEVAVLAEHLHERPARDLLLLWPEVVYGDVASDGTRIEVHGVSPKTVGCPHPRAGHDRDSRCPAASTAKGTIRHSGQGIGEDAIPLAA